jgi:hypothetical protein
MQTDRAVQLPKHVSGEFALLLTVPQKQIAIGLIVGGGMAVRD